MLATVLLSLAASIMYGVSDFAGVVGARRLRVLPATGLTNSFAFLAILAALPVFGGAWSQGSIVWGALAGLAAVGGFIAFYAALAAGPISLAAPFIAVVSSLVPVAIALGLGERLSFIGWVGVALAIVGGGLISFSRDESARIAPRTVVIALVSGALLGLSVVALSVVPDGSGVTAGVVHIGVGVIVTGVLLLGWRFVPGVRRRLGMLDQEHNQADLLSLRSALLASAAAGLLLGGANVVLILALQSGSLAIVSVLVGIYPITTILLARIVHGERMRPAQIVGVALALGAAALLSLA